MEVIQFIRTRDYLKVNQTLDSACPQSPKYLVITPGLVFLKALPIIDM
jgi:hypothetical protein